MIELYLIRHAESLANRNPEIISGRSNHSPLTELGRKQASDLSLRLKEELKDKRIEVYSSPAVRAIETAKLALPELKQDEIILSEDLYELDQGIWTGRKRVEIYTPETISIMGKDSWNFKARGGESQNEVSKRMYSWVKRTVLSRDENLTVVAFTHGVAIKCLLREILEFNPAITWRFQIDNTSITELRYGHGDWWPVRINDSFHAGQETRLNENSREDYRRSTVFNAKASYA